VHTVGRHLLAEYYDCDPRVLDDERRVQRAIRAATRAAGATVVAEAYHHFAPHGVSASILIAESHLSLHTWPEAGYAAADLFTCGELDPTPGVAVLATALGARRVRTVEIVRGLPADLAARPARARRRGVPITRLGRVRVRRRR
jgi:S-adenosylmethionine decarboxylase